MAVIYEESYYLPEALWGVIDDKILDKLRGKTLWYMTAGENGILGTVIYSIMPDRENAVLEYVYLADGCSIGSELLAKSIYALKEHEITGISVFFDDRYWKADLKERLVKGLERVCKFAKYTYLAYDYSQLEDGDIVSDLDEVSVYTHELGYIDNAEDADAWDVRDILDDMDILYAVHEQNNGIGRFYLDEDKKLVGVALGRSDETSNYFVTDYYDSESRENARTYRKVILGIIRDYLSSSERGSHMEICCSNTMMEDFLIRNFGEAKEQGEVMVCTIDLQKIKG